MENMFELEGAVSFNQPLNKWNVSNVRDMYRMFAGARSFNQPLNKWNVSKVIERLVEDLNISYFRYFFHTYPRDELH